MDTSYVINTSTKSNDVDKNATTNNWYSQLIEKATFSYFGVIAMTITIGSILGGIAAMYIFQNNAPIWELALCMAISMANNVAAIGQAPAKWVINIFAACVVLNVLFIVINL